MQIAFAACSASAQDAPGQATMYATMIQSKGYVVGSGLTGSGLARRDGEAWHHVGHNNPRINALTYDPAHPDTMFVAAGNGALRTYDGGASWRITTDWRITEVQDVSLDPQVPTQVYIGTAYGIWRSDDRGETWKEASPDMPWRGIYTETIEVDRTQARRVLAGTDDGIYLTTDAAATWRRVGAAGLEVLDLQQSRTDPNVWLAATYKHGILLSSDGGRTWSDGPRDLADKSVHGVAIDPFDANNMVAAGWDTGVFVSADGGRSWQRRGASLPVDDFYEVVFDANVPGRIWAATLEEGLYASDDQGRTWTLEGLDGTLIFDLAFVYPAGARP
jgi:photosystem II stability/assembly factor-like uncharacterized protein